MEKGITEKVSLFSGDSVNRAYFESLTTSSLIDMAESAGIEIPPDLDRIFIIGELLDFYSQDASQALPSLETELQEKGVVESVQLPDRYNITFIEAIVRDPSWVFVSWEVKALDKEQLEGNPDFGGYYLKVTPAQGFPSANADSSKAPGVFTIPVAPEDKSRYLGLDPVDFEAPSGQGRTGRLHYKVELCASVNGEETVLALCNPIKLPGFFDPLGKASGGKLGENEVRQTPLSRLSGYGEFNVLRNNERTMRTKKGAAPV